MSNVRPSYPAPSLHLDVPSRLAAQREKGRGRREKGRGRRGEATAPSPLGSRQASQFGSNEPSWIERRLELAQAVERPEEDPRRRGTEGEKRNADELEKERERSREAERTDGPRLILSLWLSAL